ncbi:MAG: hypothetical protein WCX80_05020 [Patescibacteria group bacterium]|jgi:hypothetical protein
MEKSSQHPSFGQGLELAIIIEKAINNAVKKYNSNAQKVQELIEKPGAIFKFFEELLADKIETKSSILKLISGGEKIMIEVSDGKATIANAANTFKSYLDSDFKDRGLDTPGLETPEILVDIHEIIEDANFSQIFTGLNPDLDKLVLTQAQIIRFCEKHPTWLRQEENATLFLTKVNGEYFVVSVCVYSDGLDVDVNRFEDGSVWRAGARHRLVAPQLIS